jgi:hypothetical protein
MALQLLQNRVAGNFDLVKFSRQIYARRLQACRLGESEAAANTQRGKTRDAFELSKSELRDSMLQARTSATAMH